MADEKPKSRRGGKRPGAGRKPKGHVPATTIPTHVIRAAAFADEPEAIEGVARDHLLHVFRGFVAALTDVKISDHSRVRAANNILSRAYGKPTVDTGIDMLPFMVKPQTTVPGDVRALCKANARLAIEMLRTIFDRSESESARFAAGEALADRGLGTVGGAALANEKKAQTFGKKEAQKIAAEVRVGGGGKFAAPAPPPNAGTIQ